MASQNSTNKKTFKEISIVAGVGEATIKKCYNLMLPRAVELFPENLKFFFSEENSQTIEQLPFVFVFDTGPLKRPESVYLH